MEKIKRMIFFKYIFELVIILAWSIVVVTSIWALITVISHGAFTDLETWFISLTFCIVLVLAAVKLKRDTQTFLENIKLDLNDPHKATILKVVSKKTQKWPPPPLTASDISTIDKVLQALIKAGVLAPNEISSTSIQGRLEEEGEGGQIDIASVLFFGIPEVAGNKNIILSNIAVLGQGSQMDPDYIQEMVSDILRIIGHRISSDDISVEVIEEKDEKNCLISFILNGKKHSILTKYYSKYPPDLEPNLSSYAPLESGKSLFSAYTDQAAIVTFITPKAANILNEELYDKALKDERYDKNVYFEVNNF